MAQIAMRRPRVAINAPVLAPPVRIDRLLEGNVRTVIAGNDAFGGLDHHMGFEGLEIARLIPAIVKAFPGFALKATGAV